MNKLTTIPAFKLTGRPYGDEVAIISAVATGGFREKNTGLSEKKYKKRTKTREEIIGFKADKNPIKE